MTSCVLAASWAVLWTVSWDLTFLRSTHGWCFVSLSSWWTSSSTSFPFLFGSWLRWGLFVFLLLVPTGLSRCLCCIRGGAFSLFPSIIDYASVCTFVGWLGSWVVLFLMSCCRHHSPSSSRIHPRLCPCAGTFLPLPPFLL